MCKVWGVWGSGPQTDKHLPQRVFTGNFLDDDILHCLLSLVLSFYAFPTYFGSVSLLMCCCLNYCNLKGHGNEADFLGFLQKSVRHRFLTLHFQPFRFGLRIRGDIRNRLAEWGSRQECL
jgi:hypothetical protein